VTDNNKVISNLTRLAIVVENRVNIGLLSLCVDNVVILSDILVVIIYYIIAYYKK